MSIRVSLARRQAPEDERHYNRISGGQVTAQALTEDGSCLERAKD